MSLSCEKISASDGKLTIKYPDQLEVELSLIFIEMLDTESLKKLMYYIQIELSNRHKEFDNEAYGSEQA